jgi:hypothetical protein
MSSLKQSIRQRLLQNSRIRDVVLQMDKWYFTILCAISPVLSSKHLYHRIIGKKLDLRHPRDFNEKLQWLKLYWRNPLVVKCTDKYEVRDYVAGCGCENILNQLYGVYDHASEIDWDKLPHKFALKCTHGCKCNVICNDKGKLDKDRTLAQLREWLRIRYDRIALEVHYARIKPRIICEQYIETAAGLLPIDYKVYCFNGEPKLVLVCTDRGSDLKFTWMDLDWQRMDIGTERFRRAELPRKPDCLAAMIYYARKLASPFPFVRIDFYDFNGKPVFGEMTFTPAGCMITYHNEMGLQLLGEMLQLPSKYR